ncbi:class I SAM-dependent methyltransferase [Actinokineospora guangxiensis]|uniref:Class I SAM-dependent methyltransferase n=1 Tax=Actinokineospora guangxiensis TaxID=1490288 RepID=A0ABW0EFW3_9PSEU
MNLLARAWDEAAEGYEAYFVPRFAPWVAAAVEAVPPLPDGPVLVPCCGTFPEAAPLLSRLGRREVVGIDLSPGMVRLARARVAGLAGVRVEVGDAAEPAGWADRCAGVVSVFGLQQLPAPDEAIATWVRALAPGGWLSVAFWPEVSEEDGPFALMRRVLDAMGGARSDRAWEGRLVEAIAGAGGEVVRDEFPAFAMEHRGAAECFTAYADSGPLRASALAKGPEFIERVKADFLAAAPEGPWRHTPRARLLVARRAR